MALYCDWNTKIITVPKSDLTLVSGTRYSLTVIYWFQLLRELNGTVEGMAETIGAPIFRNVPPTASTPRIVDVINGYTVQFEDGLYSMEFTNGNTNIRDVEIKNQVSVGSNNTTGFIDPKFLEFGLFNGGITVDLNNITGNASSDLTFPTGTDARPVDNLDGLHELLSKGFNKVYIKGDFLLDGLLSWQRITFIGESAIKTLIEVDEEADVFNCEFVDCMITGVLDGSSQIERAVLTNIDFVDGFVHLCSLGAGYVTLGTSSQANFYNCFSTVAGVETPTIDMNETGILALRNYNGGALVTNYSGNGSHSIDLGSGQIVFGNITGGTWVVRGVGKLVDINGDEILSGSWNGATIINELITESNIRRLKDILEADEIKDKNLNKYFKLRKGTADIILEKDYSDSANEETLKQP